MPEKKRFSPNDVYKLITARRLRLHPTEDLAAIVWRAAADRKRYQHRLDWITGLGSSAPAATWDPLDGVDEFQWSPAGDRYLMVRRQDGATVLSLGLWQGGSTVDRVTSSFRLAGSPDSLTWSADGRRVAFAMPVREHDTEGTLLMGTDQEDAVFFRNLVPFKQESSAYWAGSWSQLFMVELGANGAWTIRQLTDAAFDHLMPSLSPDGRSLAYVRPAHGEDRHWGNQALMVLDLEDGTHRVLSEMGGWYWHPTWAPSGNGIAWLGHDSRHGKGEGTDTRLYVQLNTDDAPREVSRGLERTLEDVMIDDCNARGTWPLVWSTDESELYGLVTNGSRTSLYGFSVQGASAPWVVVGGDRRVFTFSHAQGRFLFGVGAPNDPCRVMLHVGSEEREIAAPNRFWLADREFSEPRFFTYAGARGDTIEGWLVPPVGRPLEGAPLVMQLNRGRWGWSFYLETQILAAEGFAVAFVNPHGSYGYGETFRNATHYNPATLEMEDFLLARDHLVGLGIDADRVGINGTSFGGFSVNWLASHHSDRFRAGVAQASYCNRHNLWGSSSIGPSRWDHPGPSWSHAEFLLEKSPLMRVEDVTIPLLLIHGERDTICPLEQAEQWFTALTIAGKDPAWIILRGEAHDLARNARPGSRVARMNAIRNWFRRHLLGLEPVAA